MSENIPESIPTSADRRSHRPVKRARGPATAVAAQSSAVEHLFAQADREIVIPSAATKAVKRAGDMAPPPEIVANVQGSSAGAGSGEFHVYKQSRRREYERIRLMQEEAKKEDADLEWAKKQEELRKKDEDGRSKNAKRRDKAKARKKGLPADTKEESGVSKGIKPGGRSAMTIELAKRRRDGSGDDDNDDDGQEGTATQNRIIAEEEKGIVIHDDD